MLYDFGGQYSEFKTRITPGLSKKTEWVRQELAGSRVPIVRTAKRAGLVEVLEEAFAVAPHLPPSAGDKAPEISPIECMSVLNDIANFANPSVACDPAFRHVMTNWRRPVHYRFPAKGDAKYTVVLGLCEGQHGQPGLRPLELRIEGRTRKKVDLAGEHGHNVPVLIPLEARDLNGDGWIDVEVAIAEGSGDVTSILNVLWVFRGEAPPLAELMAGRSDRPALGKVDCGFEPSRPGAPRHDVLLVRLKNPGPDPVTLTPTVTIDSHYPIKHDPTNKQVVIGPVTTLVCTQGMNVAKQSGEMLVLELDPLTIPAGQDRHWAMGVMRGHRTRPIPKDTQEAISLRDRAEKYWNELDLPYDRIEVPDANVQALLDSCIRNIYQTREIRHGLPCFQVGPTIYRGLWVIDGSFLMETMAFLNRAEEARNGMHYLLGLQRDDGAIMLLKKHWKETGIALWAVTRHARLTGDKDWLNQVWPKVERGVAFIEKLRQMASVNPKAPNYRLIPAGLTEGGLDGPYIEYSNIYWNLAGMRAVIDAARWLGKTDQADHWQSEYDDFYATFRKAAERDMRTDAHGNRYLPIVMGGTALPQKAQWAFLHAVFPGKIFATDDPLVLGNLAMLRATERQGLVVGTGWKSDGIWSFFGSLCGHAWLWTGDGTKAAQMLYAFANHASPLLVWREEQSLLGHGSHTHGDMPQNWAGADFIRLVRHLLVLERGEELHLFEGLPPSWVRPGAVAKLRNVLTEFGPISFTLRVADDGTTANLRLEPPQRNPPKRIVLHLGGWAKRSDPRATIELPSDEVVERQIKLNE